MQDLVSLVLDLLFGGQSTHLYHRIISPWSPLLSDSSQRRKIDLIFSAGQLYAIPLEASLVVWLVPPEYKRQQHPKLSAAHLELTEAKAVSDIAPTTGFPDPQVPSQISH